MPDLSGGLNGSTQHFLAVYSQEPENLKFVVGVDLSAVGLCSSGNIVVRACLCFRSSRVARGFVDRRSRPAHSWAHAPMAVSQQSAQVQEFFRR